MYNGRMRTAVVLGATGLVGSACLDVLLDHPEYTRVSALTRRPLERSHPKLVQHIVDYDRLDEAEGDRIDDVFACLGTTIKVAGSQARFRQVDHDYTLRAADWARARGAARLALVSSVGANHQASNFYLRVKGETERDLAALAFPCLELFRPSLLLGARAEDRPGERIAILFGRPMGALLVGALSKWRPIDAEKVARAMVNAVVNGEPGVHVRHHDDIVRFARAVTS